MVIDTVRSLWRSFAWYVKGILGENAYDGYLAWHGRHGTGEPLTRSAYWRARTDHQERHPEGRCC